MIGQGPESGIPSGPRAAVAYLSPPNYDLEASELRPFFTPEGYDVHDPEQAAAYLTEVHGRELPQIRGDLDASTGFHLAMAMAHEDRAAMYGNGRLQNVAEHSFNLTMTTTWTALSERPDLDAGKVAIMASNHDAIVEAYGGDTVITDPVAMASKRYREAAGMTLFLQDAGDNPIADLMREYEAGSSPEARFVNAMDKVEAYQFALATKAELHRERGERFEEVVIQALPKAAIDATALDKMQAVLKQLGRKWNEWGCAPLDSNPDEIVDTIVERLLKDVATVFPLPYLGRVAAETVQPDAEIIAFPEPEETTPAKQPAEPGAPVAIMEVWRRRKEDRPDPTPPGSPNITALVA